MEERTVPDVVFKTRVRDESVAGPNPYRWQDVHTDKLFKGKRTVVFSLPGAFTPTCSNRQCPAYDLIYDDLRKQGIDEVYCISVNDAFVMYQWARTLGIKNIKLIPDGNGQFTRRIGMLVNKEHLGFGYRSWRYAMVVNDAFVMHQWARTLGIKNIKLIPDGNGQFTRRMGMLINKEHLGFGYRSWRYAMVVDDGVVEKWFEEPGINDTGADDDPYGETDPERVLAYLAEAGDRRRLRRAS